MDYLDYMRVKSEIEKEYRYYCCESAFRTDPQYAPQRDKYRALHNKLAEWEISTLEKALRHMTKEYFNEI